MRTVSVKNTFLSTLSLRRATRANRLADTPPQFLSTLSLRRATQNNMKVRVIRTNFYPRSPCGERLPALPHGIQNALISIHALLAESDVGILQKRGHELLISIHALLAESDARCCGQWHLLRISIHALLAESDAAIGKPTLEITYFYPRSPCGERPAIVVYIPLAVPFLSTLSLRRATR